MSRFERLIERRWLLWCLLLLVPRLPFFFAYDFLNVDEAAHWLGARTLLAADLRLYADFVDNKPPLIYFFYAPAVALLPARWAMLGVHVFFALAVVLPTAWALASSLRERQRGTLAGAFYLLLSGAFVASDGLAANTEQLLLLPLSWAVCFSLRPAFRTARLCQWSVGVLVGLAALAKQPALLCLLAFPFADEREEVPAGADGGISEAVARLWFLGTGALVPLALCGLLLRSRGSFADAAYWIVEYNLGHVKAPLSLGDVGLRSLTMLLPLAATWLPALLLPRLAFGGKNPRARFLSLLLLGTLLPAFLGARFFGHYFLPALYTATLLTFSRAVPRWAFGYAALSAVGFVVANVFVTAPSNKAMVTTLTVNEQVGRVLREDRCAGPLFVWGYAPQLYQAAERAPASRFVVPIDTISGFISGNLAYERGQVAPQSRIVLEHRQQLLLDLLRNKPAFVVDTAPSADLGWQRHPLASWPELATLVQQEFEAFREIDGVRILRRRGCTLDN